MSAAVKIMKALLPYATQIQLLSQGMHFQYKLSGARHFPPEGMAKVFPQFLLYKEKENKCRSSLLAKTGPKNHRTEESAPLIPYNLIQIITSHNCMLR